MSKKYPVPNYLSEEAKAILSAPMGEAIPAIANYETWKAMREGIKTQLGPMLEQLIRENKVNIQEQRMGSVKVFEILPKETQKLKEDQVIMLLHGGGFSSMDGRESTLEGIRVSAKGGYRIISVDYRMLPDHPFPAAIEDGVEVYRELLQFYPAEKIAIMGGSAGGNLAVATSLYIRDRGLPLPGAVIANTPWSDLNKVGDSYFTNEFMDPVLISYEGGMESIAKAYADGENLMNHLLSPVYADYKEGFSPTFLSSGTRDLFLSNTVRLHRELRKAGIKADLHVFDAMWHGLLLLTEEGGELVDEIISFLEEHIQ